MKRFLIHILKGFLLGIGIFVIYGVILYLNGDAWYGNNAWDFFVDNQIFSVSLYMANTYVIEYYLTKYKGQFWKKEKFIKGVISAIGVTILTVFLIRLILRVFVHGMTFDVFFTNEKIEFYYSPLIISAIATSIFYGVYYWKSKQDNKVKQSKIIAGAASAQFDALKNQLDPHFLFNSLNVLASLIEENPKQAQKFTTSLSKVYRYVLEQKSKELVPLDEELAFAKTYMNLLKMRFEESILIDIPENASNADYKVVPLSLQLLLENAVKHNKVTPLKKLSIRIYEEGNKLVIENNIQTKQVVKKSSGVGLLNIRRRYNLLSNSTMDVLDDGEVFKVRIPLLTQVEQVSFKPKQTELLEDKRYQRAKQKVEKLKGFYIHASIYLIMVPVFIYLNIKSTSFPWALFPILGWGWGVAGHAADAFNWNPFFGDKWESKKIDDLMNNDRF